jgi:hypothetical protein
MVPISLDCPLLIAQNKKTKNKQKNTTQKAKMTRNSKMLDTTMHKHTQKHNKT